MTEHREPRRFDYPVGGRHHLRQPDGTVVLLRCPGCYPRQERDLHHVADDGRCQECGQVVEVRDQEVDWPLVSPAALALVDAALADLDGPRDKPPWVHSVGNPGSPLDWIELESHDTG